MFHIQYNFRKTLTRVTKLYFLINDIKIPISSVHIDPSVNLKQNDDKSQLLSVHDFQIIHRTSNNYHRRNTTDNPPSKPSIEFAQYELEV